MSQTDPKRKLFIMVLCKDRPGQEARDARQKYMQGHLDHVDSIMDHILIAGPIFADDQKTVTGSTLVYKTTNKAQAQAWLEGDPYYQAPIWESVEFHLFRGALGEAVGGKAY